MVQYGNSGTGLYRIILCSASSDGITADTALRFARYFKNAPAFWMNLQTRYDLEVAEDEIAAKVARDVQPLEALTGPEA